ncbi:MAG: hypothetical protein GF329_06070 [Candidatus Lokiarchaeota archaeon]|nr:hypothetical protein [Candidatus Lokiarchaeota archaeon]
MAFDPITTLWFWIAFIGYLVLLAIIGYISHKKTKTITDFLLASRGIGTVLLGLSYGVTYFSAVLLIGCPGITWLAGQQWILVTLMNLAFGTFGAFLILGNRSRRMSKKLGALTLPELIAERYQDDKYIRPASGIVIAVFQTIYLVSIFAGLSTLLQVLFPGIPYAFYIAVILCGAITSIYLIIGGAHSAILSDLVESIIMLIGVLGIIIGGLFMVGGIANMNANILTDIAASPGPFQSNPEAWFIFPNITSMAMIGMAVVTTFGTWGSPQMATRFFTAKNRKTIRYGMIIACIWVFIVSFCAWWAGAVGRGLLPNSTATITDWMLNDLGVAAGTSLKEYVMPWLIADTGILPLGFAALFLAAVTAASLTTGEKIIIVASSAISRDFWQKGIAKDKNISDERTLFWTRIIIVIIVIVAVLLTFLNITFILDLCMFSWASLCAFTLVPFVAGLYWRKGTKRAAFISGILALITAVCWFFFFRDFKVPWLPLFPNIAAIELLNWPIRITIGSIHEVLVSLAVAIPSFFIISLIDKKNRPDKAFLDDLFDYSKEDIND